MSTADLKASGAVVSSSGTITYTGGSADYTNLNDASDSTYSGIAGTSGYAIWPILTNLPSDISEVTAISIVVRASRATKGDISSPTTAQIFKSDGTTAISASAAFGTVTAGAANYTMTPSVTLSGQTDWNDACIKILTDAGVAVATIYEITVTITYTPSGGFGSGGPNPGASLLMAM